MRETEKLFDAITNVRADLVEEAQCCRFTKKIVHWQRYAGMAACLALMVMVGFGALRFGIIGGMGGSNSAASDSVADTGTGGDFGESMESANGSANDWPTSDSAQTDTDTDKGSMPDLEGGVDSDAEEYVFLATILEVYENAVLVEPAEGSAELQSADRIYVSLRDVEDLPQVQVGDTVRITYDGAIAESYPAQIAAIAMTEA